MAEEAEKSILFVCMGNICRSPMAEGVFKQFATHKMPEQSFLIDSAGTGNWHEGDPPDSRAIATMKRHKIDISSQKSRPVDITDFERFDLILAMDHDNLSALQSRLGSELLGNTYLFMDYAISKNIEVPDPYYGSGDGFENVYKMLLEGCEGMLSRLQSS